jgi:hypothetical protein
MKTIYAFCGGAAIVGLLAAAMFRNTTPVDQTFTYQGQLRNAGQLVNGPVDLKISMWDADTAGVQIGTSNTFNAVPMTDGRFALGLNFGASAFDGSNRWIQVEFRNPAGSGLYLALNPRDKITATPYALYALNGSNGVWVYDTKQQSVSVLGKKVGIGTSNPTAALEVVSATGGDDAVKLPVECVGVEELAKSARSQGFQLQVSGPSGDISRSLSVARPGFVLINVAGRLPKYYNSTVPWADVSIDGVAIGVESSASYVSPNIATFLCTRFIPVSVGTHTVRLTCGTDANASGGNVYATVLVVDEMSPTP